MKKTHRITLTNETTYTAIGELNSGHCRQVGNDKGEVFTSIIDAAKAAGVTQQYMWRCLQPDGPRTCKGHVYFYVDKRDESFDRVMSRLNEVSAENESRKADAEDARKWREYQAELEAIRKAEEKRLADELKAKADHEAAITKAQDRVTRRKAICERLEAKLADAQKRLMEAEIELETLMDMDNGNEEEVAA